MTERPHVLIVRDAGVPYTSRNDSHPWVDWEIVHFNDCPTEVIDHDDAGTPVEELRCAVGAQEDQGEVRWNLAYSGTPVDQPGRYLVEFWEHHPYFDEDYDAGLRLVENDEAGDAT